MQPSLMLTHLRLAGWEPVDMEVMGFQRVADGFTVYAYALGHTLELNCGHFESLPVRKFLFIPEAGSVEIQARAMICLVQYMEDSGLIARISGVTT